MRLYLSLEARRGFDSILRETAQALIHGHRQPRIIENLPQPQHEHALLHSSKTQDVLLGVFQRIVECDLSVLIKPRRAKANSEVATAEVKIPAVAIEVATHHNASTEVMAIELEFIAHECAPEQVLGLRLRWE